MVKVDVRGKRLSKFSDEATSFTSSIGFDGPLSRHVVAINMAHTLMLLWGGWIHVDKAEKILSSLLELTGEPNVGRPVEDIHEAVEQYVVDKWGVEVAGYMNWGKSRNDQVATALRMAVRGGLVDLSASLIRLQSVLLEKAKNHAHTAFPGYTHLQRAQLITLGHHLLAYFDSLSRSQQRIQQVYQRVNLCPMGSAALAGSYLNLDREKLAGLLGFSGIVGNSVDGVSSRDFAIETIFVCSLVMLELSRMAEEVVLWSSREFGFVEVGDEYAATSSLMPHKKNPVVAETVRAKTSTVLGCLLAAASTIKGLPYTYNLDFQEITRALWAALEHTVASVKIMSEMFASLEFKREAISRATEDESFAATALAHRLTALGVASFREAHLVVGNLVRLAEESGISLGESVKANFERVAQHTLGRRVNIDVNSLVGSTEPENLLKMIATVGGANPEQIDGELAKRHVFLKQFENWVSETSASLAGAETTLLGEVKRVLDGR
ncbi:MAG: argininosuccinate lyase [Thermoprotei archaeon]